MVRSINPELPKLEAGLLRYLAVLSICAAALTGCSSHARHATPEPTNIRVELCVDRLVAGSNASPAGKELVRRYVRDTYCRRFGQQGWIYGDGALKLAAQLSSGGTCAEGVVGQPAKVGPCKVERSSSGVLTIDCGMLRFVRRSEVRNYLRRLQADGPVACEEDIPLAKLGVP
jgi:hypothetical protein